MDEKELNKIVKSAERSIKIAEESLEELKLMREDIKLLQDKYKTDKRYFCSEGSRPTINDVIQTVFEFAWASRGAYEYNKLKRANENSGSDHENL